MIPVIYLHISVFIYFRRIATLLWGFISTSFCFRAWAASIEFDLRQEVSVKDTDKGYLLSLGSWRIRIMYTSMYTGDSLWSHGENVIEQGQGSLRVKATSLTRREHGLYVLVSGNYLRVLLRNEVIYAINRRPLKGVRIIESQLRNTSRARAIRRTTSGLTD